MNILVLDNYDSFTYNLVQILEQGRQGPCHVFKNDEITLEEVGKYDKILLSPGPGLPRQAGVMLEVIRTYAPYKSILGICLGHQAIAEVFGGKLALLPKVRHGKQSQVYFSGSIGQSRGVFKKMNSPQTVGLYHSWIVSSDNFPSALRVTATNEEGQVMALRHRLWDVEGVQFHPESFMTPNGRNMLYNWLETPSNPRY